MVYVSIEEIGRFFMTADFEAELHDMAEKIGAYRHAFRKAVVTPYYELSLDKREEAVRLGAVPMTRGAMIRIAKGLPSLEYVGGVRPGPKSKALQSHSRQADGHEATQ